MSTKIDTKEGYLSGKLLIAMPAMSDPRFHRAVIFMCAHDKDGAMGLVLNKPLPDLDFTELLSQLKIDPSDDAPASNADIQILSGGPVENARGFILHSTDFTEPDTVKVGDDYGVTGTIEAIRKITNGDAPENMIFALGYAGWSAGQLDQELQANAWLTLDADEAIVFHDIADEKWDLAIAKLGIDPGLLSTEGGHA